MKAPEHVEVVNLRGCLDFVELQLKSVNVICGELALSEILCRGYAQILFAKFSEFTCAFHAA